MAEDNTPTNVVDDYINALKQEAGKYNTFDEYEKAFSREYKRGIYYHLTDNPNFVVDLSKGATDAATGKMTPGSIMFTTDLDYWADTTWTDRPYVAILDLSDVDESQFTQVNRSQGNEFYLDDASKVKVKEVIPVDEALKQSELINQWGLDNLKNKEDLKNVIWDNRLDTPTNVVGDLITKDVLSEAIEGAFDELEGLRLAGELPGNATHGLFTRELLNVLKAKGFDMDNPENIKRLDNWALNSGFSDVKSFSDLIIADVKEPTLVQSAYPGNNFDNDLNIIRKAEPLDTIFTENVNKNVIKNEIFNDRSSLDENTIEYLKKNTDTPTNVVDDILETQLDDIRILNDSGVSDQVDNIMAGKINDLYQTDGDIESFSKYLNNLTPDSFTTPNKIKSILEFGKKGTGMRVTSKSINDGIGSRSPIIFDESRIDDLGYVTWKNLQHEYGSFQPSPNNVDGFQLVKNLVKEGNEIDFESMTDVVIPDTPGGSLGAAKLNDPLVFDSWIDNYAKTTTSFVDNLPLSTTVKNQFNNLVQGRARNLATPGGVADAVDVWELGVLGLMIAAVAYKEYDEIPTILTNKAIDMFNNMTSFYNIPPVPKEEYNLDYEFINKVVETGEKVMPTDIIIKKVGEIAKGVGEQGLATGFGYVPTTPKNTDTMETTQKIQPGVQEEKMFEQLKPQKIKSAGGSGAKIQ